MDQRDIPYHKTSCALIKLGTEDEFLQSNRYSETGGHQSAGKMWFVIVFASPFGF